MQDEQGRSDHHAFAAAIHDRPHDIVLMGFDSLHPDGEDLRKEPLIDRMARLQQLVGCHDPSCRFQFSEHMRAEDLQLFRLSYADALTFNQSSISGEDNG